MKRSTKYTTEQLTWIRDNQGTIRRDKLHIAFNKRFGTNATCGALANICTRNKWHSKLPSWNKGKPIKPPASFKPGHAIRSKPVGYEVLRSDGFIWVKTAQPKKYRRKHLVVWEKEHGKRRASHEIRFLDGDKTNCAIENLISVPRDIAITINHHNPADMRDPTFNEAIYLTETIKHHIKAALENKRISYECPQRR